MSVSTSRSLLDAIRRGERPSHEEVRSLAEQAPSDFFREVVEPLSDSFDPALAAAYDHLMLSFIPALPPITPALPAKVDTVYVLSRVTLGADIKITSLLLDGAKKRFPDARIVFVGGRKSAELFAADSRIEHLEVNYPRSGPVTARIDFAHNLRQKLDTPNSIVLDPDSRITQLGLLPVTAPDRYFHFPSRTTEGGNLTAITQTWVRQTLGVDAAGYMAPPRIPIEGPKPVAAISLGVGENSAKLVPGDFESKLIAQLAQRFPTLWLDRGAGGDEAARVTAAAARQNVRFWEGSFAGFASVISQCAFYVGYDSGAQHAAAAAGIPLITVFAGAPSPRFRTRWTAAGPGPCLLLDADTQSPGEILARIDASLANELMCVLNPHD